jgi:hypothetical protein
MRLCNSSGELIRSSALQRILCSSYFISSAQYSLSVAGAAEEQPVWIEEEHPISGLPGLSLHVCGVVDRMNLLTENRPIDDPLYLLKWLTMMGPFIGMRIEALEYARLSDEMFKRSSQRVARSIARTTGELTRPVIVGGGIHGLCIAYFLSKRGLRPIGEANPITSFILDHSLQNK